MNRLVESWKMAAKDLGIEVVAPFELKSNDVCISVELLVKGFGAPNGMLITSNYEKIADHTDYIIKSGYGYSVFSIPDACEEYDLNDFIEILNDWGRSMTNNN